MSPAKDDVDDVGEEQFRAAGVADLVAHEVAPVAVGALVTSACGAEVADVDDGKHVRRRSRGGAAAATTETDGM